MLEKLFTSKVRVGILKVLLFENMNFHLRELSRRIGATPIYVKKELENLKGLGLVIETKKANLLTYSLNEGSPIFEDIKNLFLKTDYLGEHLIKSFKEAEYALIYGSFAEGSYDSESDIDVLIVSNSEEKDFLKTLRKLEGEIGREINYVLWDKKTFERRAKSSSFLKTIKSGKIIMLVGEENEFRQKIK